MSEMSGSDKIRAAIDEVEELARRALNGPFEGMRAGAFTDGHKEMPNPSRVVKVSILPMGWDEGPHAPIYVAFDPEVVLWRCAADRKILDLHTASDTAEVFGEVSTITYCPVCNHGCPTLEALAEGYGVEL